MNWLLLIAGGIIVLWFIIEALWTTIWIDGNSSPITTRATTLLWLGWRAIFKQKRHKALSLAGPLVLFFTVASWIFFLWLGWSMMFYAQPGSLETSDGEYPNFIGTMWYVAYVMFTVGNGDFLPQGDLWQLLSSFVAFSGMGLVTLSITYVMQIVSAVVTKRSFSSKVTSIAKTADSFVAAQWTGESFGSIEIQLNALSGQLAMLNEQHLAYPILHYYHAKNADKSSSIALPVLDDALTIIMECVEESKRPSATVLKSIRASISSYMSTLKAAHIHASKEVPPLPDWEELKRAGVPVCDKNKFEQKFRENGDRRKLLLGLTQNAAWRWPSKLESNG
ncbi:potassium channel family protein [Cesiribacter sp. SM1]|uniref:potassium channel family protein n=1 Tax=Cesiribacter sp. SM1 TaxID=2861196 RepID=UPI001CD73236|nr:potassium channel family protein [Cesiribacter sp. SM1]